MMLCYRDVLERDQRVALTTSWRIAGLRFARTRPDEYLQTGWLGKFASHINTCKFIALSGQVLFLALQSTLPRRIQRLPRSNSSQLSVTFDRSNAFKMVEYVPPPADLSKLNPVQRYLQKGQLDRQDYIYLCLLVAIYFIARPAIQNFFAWFMGGSKEVEEGEKEREAYNERRARVSANAIRGGKDEPEDITSDPLEGTTSGANVKKGANGEVSNRKTKGPKGEKSEADKLLDWDDEPPRAPVEGDKSEITKWLDHWD